MTILSSRQRFFPEWEASKLKYYHLVIHTCSSFLSFDVWYVYVVSKHIFLHKSPIYFSLICADHTSNYLSTSTKIIWLEGKQVGHHITTIDMPMPLSSTHDLFVFCFRIIMKVLSSTAFEREKLYLNLCHILFNAATVCLRFPMYLKTLTAAQEYRTIFIRRTRIVRKGRLHVTSFIFKYKTPTTYPLYETTRHFLLINKGRL